MNEITCHELKSIEYNIKKIGSLVILVTNVNRMLKEGMSYNTEKSADYRVEDLKGYVNSCIDDLNAFYDLYCDVEGEVIEGLKRMKTKHCGGDK